MNRDFLTSYHNKATQRDGDASLQTLRAKRDADVMGHDASQHTAQSINESLNRWFKMEGLTLAGDQMMRLNEYFIRPEDEHKGPSGPTSAWEQDGRTGTGTGGGTGRGTGGQIVFMEQSMVSMDAISEAEAADMLDDILPQVNLEQNTETGSVHIEHAY